MSWTPRASRRGSIRSIAAIVSAVTIVTSSHAVGEEWFCKKWDAATLTDREYAASAQADKLFSESYTDVWPRLRPCVLKSVQPLLADIGVSCTRQGDYSGGFAMGFNLYSALLVCVQKEAAE